jgi:type VI secretion system protein ImpL
VLTKGKTLVRTMLVKAAKRIIVPLALVAFSLALWFAGPMMAYADYAPLAGFWTRVILISLVWVTYIGVVAYRFYKRRKAQRALEASVVDIQEETGDSEELSKRMDDALATLRKSANGRNFLYDLPWYVIIGPPGAGKTTALINSGLKFPLAAAGGSAALTGVGGTRYCDWWFAEEAVMIDTAGRYTTQDSDAKSDEKSWLHFLSQLKEHRAKQPINGVILAISLEDIMLLSADEINSHANAIRKRLLELHEHLKIDFPVYAIFTKGDLVSGFNEFFSSFPEERRRQVWGATFQTDDRKKNCIDQIPAEFDALVERLTEETADRLQAEPDAMARIAIFGFPAQMANLRDPIAQLLNAIFEPTRYHANAHLRGFYFSSGTQQGTPIDQVLGAMGTSFSADSSAYLSGQGKSYFLHDLLKKVIFPEAGWVSRDMKAIRRSRLLRYGAMSAIVLVAAALSTVWIASFYENRRLIESTNSSIAEYRTIGAPALSGDAVNDSDLHSVIDLLHKLRNLEAGYANKDKTPPWTARFGLSQRERLTVSGNEAYRTALERTLRSRLIYRLEKQISTSIDDPTVIYEALKVYLMLGGKAPKADNDFIVAWTVNDWEQNLYQGPSNRAGREELETHLRAMLELDDGYEPKIELNGSLVDSAQQALVRLSLADRAYSLIKSEASSAGLPDWTAVEAGQGDTALVFETSDGSPLEELRVDGLYTYAGFHTYFLNQLGEVAEKLLAESWVLGKVGEQAAVEKQFSALGRTLLGLYRRDFVAQWDGVLGKIRLKRMSADKPQYLTIAAASSANTPIRNLFVSIAAETTLTKEPAEDPAVPAAPEEGVADEGIVKELAKIATQRARDRATGWTRIGIDLALKKSQKRLGAGAGAERPTVPGEEIEAYFRPYHLLVEGEAGNRPVDQLVVNLYEIYQSLLMAATNPSQTARATASLQVQIVNLRANASRLPTPLQKMMEDAVADFEGDAAGSTISQLNQQLSSEVTRTCQEIAANRYPFVAESERDVPVSEFAKLFAPNGIIDKFFNERMAPMVDMSAEPWSWKQDGRVGQDLSKTTLREFQRAAQIRDAFFPTGSPMIGLQMVVKPNTISGNADMVLMEVNGTVIQSQQVGNAPVDLTWPASGAGSASITIFPEIAGRKSTISAAGQWAFRRLISMGSVSAGEDGIGVRFVIDGREVSYKIEVSSLRNPFVLPALEEFKCPAGF